MAILKFRKKFLIAQMEALGSYGVDTVPTGSEAIETRGLAISPYQGNVVTQDIDRESLGAQSQVNTGPNTGLNFSCGYQGSGTAGTAPQFAKLLRACGFAETLVASTSATYDPVSTDYESLAAYYFHDGERHRCLGMRGNMTMNMARGALPLIGFEMRSLYERPTAPAAVTPDFSAAVDPIPLTKANTPTVEFLGYTGARLESLNLNMNNQVIYRNVPNGEEVFINDREITGQLAVEAPDIGTKNFWSDVESHQSLTTGAINLVHGTAAGRIAALTAPKAQLSNIAMSDVDGLTIYTMDIRLLPDTGDDEIKLAFT